MVIHTYLAKGGKSGTTRPICAKQKINPTHLKEY